MLNNYIPSCPKLIELRLAPYTDWVLHARRQSLRANGCSRITYAGTVEHMIMEHRGFAEQLHILRKELDTGWIGFWRRIGKWFGFC